MGPGERAYRKAQRRRVMGSALVLYTFAAVLLLFGFSPRIAAWWFEVPESDPSNLRHFHFEIPLLSMLVLGLLVSRQLQESALLTGRSAQWLRTTPWHPTMPLPLASPGETRTDLLLLAPIAALCIWLSPKHAGILLVAILFAIAFRSLLTNLFAKRTRAVVFALLVAAGCLLSNSFPVRFCILSAAALLLIVSALFSKPAFVLIEPEPKVDRFGGLPGWVRRQMPLVQHEPRQRGLGLKIAGVVFWLAFCVLQVRTMTADEERSALSFSFMIALIIAVARWAIYVGRHHAPISLRGRWQTGTWLIPSHDRVIVAPLVSTIIVLIVLTLCLTLSVPFSVSIPLLPAIALAICIESGPTLRNWTLTGRHNVPRSTMKELSAGSNSMSGRK